jgi:hypothetical protein
MGWSTNRRGKPPATRPFTFWIALVAFGLACFALNPLRETAVGDDWAYALTVKNLHETGHYRLT